MKKAIILTIIVVAVAGASANAAVTKLHCQGDSQNQKFEIEFTKGQSLGHASVILEDGQQLSGELSVKMGQAGTRLAASKILDVQAQHFIPGFSKPHTILSRIAVSLVLTGSNPRSAGGFFSLKGLELEHSSEDTVSCLVENF